MRTFLISILLTAMLWTVPANAEVRSLASTPFDAKMASAGAFSLGVSAAPAPEGKDVDRLFREARSFRYRKDERGDEWQSPQVTERARSGDCEDMALWLYAKLLGAGRSDARLVIGRYGRERGLHVWVTVSVNDRELLLDPAKQKRVWELRAFGQGQYVPLFSYHGERRFAHF